MSMISAENFHEGIPKSLALFDLPPTHVAVNDTFL
jgi:hypothetical protein